MPDVVLRGMTGISSSTKGALLALGAFSLWAWSDVVVKYLSSSYQPLSILFYNGAFTLLMLLAASPWLGGLSLTLRSPHMKLHLLRGVVIFAQFLLLVYAFSTMSMAKAYAIGFSAPFIVTIMAIFILDERASFRHWVAVAIGFLGVLVILRPGIIPIDMPAIGMILSAALFAASNVIGRLINRRGGEKETLMAWAFLPEISRMVLTMPLFAMNPQWILSFTDAGLFVLTSLGSIAGAILISRAMAFAPAGKIMPFQYTQMIWAIFFGYILFGDIIDAWMMVGVALIVLSGLWLMRMPHSVVLKAE